MIACHDVIILKHRDTTSVIVAKGRNHLPFFFAICRPQRTVLRFFCRLLMPFNTSFHSDQAQGSTRESTPRTGAVAKKDPRGYRKNRPARGKAYQGTDRRGTGRRKQEARGRDGGRHGSQLTQLPKVCVSLRERVHHGTIITLALHQEDGMGQRQKGEGSLLDMRDAYRLHCRTFKHRSIMGT